MSLSSIVFQGRAGDRNDLAIPGALSIGNLLREQLGVGYTTVGTPEPALSADWRIELDAALPALCSMRDRLEEVMSAGNRCVAATSRCAVSIATLPVIARLRADACVVWFDAHADLNTPDTSASGYLGGLALSGPIGLWETGLGAGLLLDNVVLVGQRDLDPFELELIRAGKVQHIKPRTDIPTQLAKVIAGRPVYVHVDCDVLNPGIVPTDYAHQGGLSLSDLRRACEAIAQTEVVGLEIAEFQNSWSTNGEPVSPGPLLDSLRPLTDRMRKA
jgi:arginase family enzyme